MKLDKNCALLVIDIQQEDFMEMNESNMDDPRWACLRNGKRVLDVFRAKKLPVIQVKECYRPDMVDFGRELDGSEGIHYTAVDAHQNDYHIRVVTDAVAGSSKEAHESALQAIHYLQPKRGGDGWFVRPRRGLL